MKKTQTYSVPISGMHCRSCELLIQDELAKLKGVQSVYADSRNDCATMQVLGHKPSNHDVEQAVKRAGYAVGTVGVPWFSGDLQLWQRIVGMAILVVLAFVFLDRLGLFTMMTNSATQPTSLSAIALLGLSAGFSTCAALVGGLLLAFSSAHAKLSQQASSLFDKFEPTIFFQVGRVLGFMLFGALLGLVGSSLQPTPFMTAVLSGFVALIMIWFGTQLTGLFPKLTTYQFSLPSWIARRLRLVPSQQSVYSPFQAAMIGGLTFFVPCGFTQIAQLYAVSTASALDAAVVMGIFALATLPGLTAVSLLGSFTHAPKTVILTQFIGVIIVLFGLYSLSSACNLAIAASPSGLIQAARMGASDTTDIQVIETIQKTYGYFPKTVTVKKGKPVRWIIDSQDQYSCASSILLAKYGINTTLKPGKNIFEFTPEEVGTFTFSCSMGMYTGTIQVVE